MAVAKSIDKPGYVMLSVAKHLYFGMSKTFQLLANAPSGCQNWDFATAMMRINDSIAQMFCLCYKTHNGC